MWRHLGTSEIILTHLFATLERWSEDAVPPTLRRDTSSNERFITGALADHIGRRGGAAGMHGVRWRHDTRGGAGIIRLAFLGAYAGSNRWRDLDGGVANH